MAGVKNQISGKTIFISEADQYLFGQGTHYDIYNKLGGHLTKQEGKSGAFFALWAPNAVKVNVIGEFNDWDEEANEMQRLGEGGIYSCFVEGAVQNQMYKFLIISKEGRKLYKADPFAAYAELRPGTASRLYDISRFKWTDSAWLKKRESVNIQKEPMSIYECHIGSWMKHQNGTQDGFYTYREFADRVVGYLKEMSYTHIELMGIAEHPYDGSWGYQVTGYYAPTSRYGTPEDFMYLVNVLHRNQIGVILDWVPAHFPKDEHGLAEFDGTPLFEYADPKKGEHPDWGTKIFDYGKPEVKNFLITNALYWVKEFHVDGLRVDAVASMLYLDYGKENGQWIPNQYGGNKNLEAIEFFRHLNSTLLGTYKGVVTIAEESTAWPKVTKKTEEDGLGFSFKWNMGWMNDFCEYMKLDPILRKEHHFAMTFAMSYNESENYILPLSHDEVVHLKCSMVNKMPGEREERFANLRVGYAYMFGHCGKKVLFMGQDFGQEHEWNEAVELDWASLTDPLHKGMLSYVKELLHIYHKYGSLHEIDNNWDGFEWMNANDGERSIFSFTRRKADGKDSLLIVLNFTPVARKEYRVGVPMLKKYALLLNSEAEEFGGGGLEIPEEIMAEKLRWDNKPYSLSFTLPGFGAAIFKF